MSEPAGVPVSELQFEPMSYDEWWALPEKPKVEWVDGVAVVNTPATFWHMSASRHVADTLAAALPRLKIAQEVGVRLPGNRVRVPDVVALTQVPDGVLATDIPVLVVEVLSPGTRTQDTVRKSTGYAGAGIWQYWTLDPESRTLDVFVDTDGGWDLALHLDAQHARGSVEVGDEGSVALELAALLDT